MFLGIEWYWWIAIIGAAGISIPIKVKFMRWWGRHRQEKNEKQMGKWGGEE